VNCDNGTISGYPVARPFVTVEPSRAVSRAWSFTTAQLPLFTLFSRSPRSLGVSRPGRFSYAFVATPGLAGTLRITSTGKLRIGSRKRAMKLGSKRFTAPASGKLKVKFRLSGKYLRALKRRSSLRFAVVVKLGGKTFDAKLKLKRPKRG